MEIQRYKACERKFKYLELVESIGWGYNNLTCRSCGRKHILKKSYLFMLIALIVLPVFFINKICKLPLTLFLKVMVLLIYLSYSSLIVGLSPFVVRYKLEGDLDKSSSPHME